MNLCSLQEVLANCEILGWPKKLLHLKVIKNAVKFDLLRGLAKLDGAVYVEEISDPKLKEDFDDEKVAGAFVPGIEFKLKLPRVVHESVVAKDLTDLLTIPSTAWELPRTYLLISQGDPPTSFCFTEETPLAETAPSSVKNYHAALRLWALLTKQADYHNKGTEVLLFFRLRRTEIKPGFETTDLKDGLPESVKKIADFIGDAEQSETRSEIFRAVLAEFLRHQSAERAFSYLLIASELFAIGLAEGLAIYMADNSPEKLSKLAVGKHLELAEKLEKVISGMEAKSLTIPIAVLFAVKEMKAGEGWVTLNVIILVSTLLYLVAMLVAHFSQREMLDLLTKTIAKAEDDLVKQGLAKLDTVLTESFQNLKNRLKNTARASLIMALLSLGPLLAAIYTAFCSTPPPKTPTDVRIVPATANLQWPAASQRRCALRSVGEKRKPLFPTEVNRIIDPNTSGREDYTKFKG